MGHEGPPGEADARARQGRPRPAVSRRRTRSSRSRATSISTQLKDEVEQAFRRLERPAETADRDHAAAGQFPPRGAEERADAHRHRVSVDPGNRPGLLHRPPGDRSPQRRDERPAVHRSPREARPVLQRLGRLQQPQRPGQHPRLRRHEQRPRAGDARLLHRRTAPPQRRRHRRPNSTAPRPA